MPRSYGRNGQDMALPKVEDRFQCVICVHPERSIIERLMAHGTYVKDIATEFCLPEPMLKRHEVLHSTCIPSIDPESVLRHIRWLNERCYFVTKGLLSEQNGEVEVKVDQKVFNMQMAAVKMQLSVITELANICNVKKNIDPYVVQPRWENTMKKLAFRLKDNPEALKVLSSFVEEEGPAETQEQLRRLEDRKKGSITAESEDLTVDIEAQAFALEKENLELKAKVESLGTFLPLKEKKDASAVHDGVDQNESL